MKVPENITWFSFKIERPWCPYLIAEDHEGNHAVFEWRDPYLLQISKNVVGHILKWSPLYYIDKNKWQWLNSEQFDIEDFNESNPIFAEDEKNLRERIQKIFNQAMQDLKHSGNENNNDGKTK